MISRLQYDLHTHTYYSHGLGSIEQNVAAAEAAGLSTIGIADHGPGHRGFGISMGKLPCMRMDMAIAGMKHPGIQILLGVEANIYNPSGKLDVQGEDISLFDYIIAGYHYGTVSREAPFKSVGMMIGGLTGNSSARTVNYNTELVLAALYENDIKILSHPGEKASFDIKEIAAACEKTHTIMEINNHHDCLTVEGIRIAMEYDVSFIIGSDAHRPANVGTFELALARADKAGLSHERIINLRKD